MKNSTQQLVNRVKSVAFISLLAVSAQLTAATFYVRPAGDATSWSALAGITPEQIITSNAPEIIGTDTYYFAKGTYVLSSTAIDPLTTLPVSIVATVTTGKIYGGFSGAETTIDLAARAVADKDGNGIVEPWEFSNETIFKGAVPYDDITGSSKRFLILTGGEVNGATLANHYYYGDLVPAAVPFSGAIILGVASSAPPAAQNLDENAGKLILCTIRNIRAGGNGPIMMTNKSSQIDRCLIEECTSAGLIANGGGGAIWMNSHGGKITNSIIRNCEAKLVGGGSGKGGAIWSTSNVESNALVYNCLIHNNSAAGYGSGLRFEGVNGGKTKGGSIINCTILNNLSTIASTTGQVELIFDGVLLVNNIILNEPNKDELRVRDTRNFISNNIYGTLMTGSAALSPGTDMVSGKNITDLKFVRPIFTAGAIGSPGVDFFDKVVYDSIRTANFKIADAQSLAVQTVGALKLPATFPSSDADATPIAIAVTIPTVDMLGVARTTTNTIGAYQFAGASALNTVYSDKQLNVIALQNSILINNQEGKVASLFSASGQLIKRVTLKSNNEIVPVTNGFYIVSVNNRIGKVVVK
jgi:hypothetical protein